MVYVRKSCLLPGSKAGEIPFVPAIPLCLIFYYFFFITIGPSTQQGRQNHTATPQKRHEHLQMKLTLRRLLLPGSDTARPSRSAAPGVGELQSPFVESPYDAPVNDFCFLL